jgi:hypothetical protein
MKRAIAWLALRIWRWADPQKARQVQRALDAQRIAKIAEETMAKLEADHAAGLLQSTPEPSLQCGIAAGSEYTIDPGITRSYRKYTTPFHVLVDGHLACAPDWKPEPGLILRPTWKVGRHRLCQMPACRDLWQAELAKKDAE